MYQGFFTLFLSYIEMKLVRHVLRSAHLSMHQKEADMNTDIIKGKWLQLKGDIRHRWGKLTDDDLNEVQGDAEKFIGKLQERYGYARDRAQKELDEFMNSAGVSSREKS